MSDDDKDEYQLKAEQIEKDGLVWDNGKWIKKEGLVFYNGEWVKEIYAEQMKELNLKAQKRDSWLLWKVGDTDIIRMSRNTFIVIVIVCLMVYLS